MAKQKIRNILFDCERMKYPHTGLYHFCLELGNALTRNSDANHEKISFYLPAATGKIFGGHASYIAQNSLHKFLFPPVGKYDIWHATYQGSNYIPAGSSVKKVLTIHDLNFLYEHEERAEKIKRSLRKIQKQIDRADKICTISAYVKQDVLQHLDLKDKKIEVIYNGCNIQHRANLQFPALLPGQPFIFTIGTITNKKNFHVLPALLRNNNLCLLIAGIVQQQDYQNKIKKAATMYGVADRVIFTGAITNNDKEWYFKNCEAFVFPSIAEGFGLPVIEAMSFGKPVFLSTATSLPEIGGNNAYYFETFDADDMEKTFQKGMLHYNAGNNANAIIKRALSFSWDAAAKKYLQLYAALCDH
jgi:glycosyltransferase involved in cell wall biosynthesis